MAGKPIVRQEDSVPLMVLGLKAWKVEEIVYLPANVGTEVHIRISAEECQSLKLQTKRWA